MKKKKLKIKNKDEAERDGLETDGREPFQIQFSKKEKQHTHTRY